jgi:hypothetical protein
MEYPLVVVSWQMLADASQQLILSRPNQSINVTPVAMKLKKLMPAIH